MKGLEKVVHPPALIKELVKLTEHKSVKAILDDHKLREKCFKAYLKKVNKQSIWASTKGIFSAIGGTLKPSKNKLKSSSKKDDKDKLAHVFMIYHLYRNYYNIHNVGALYQISKDKFTETKSDQCTARIWTLKGNTKNLFHQSKGEWVMGYWERKTIKLLSPDNRKDSPGGEFEMIVRLNKDRKSGVRIDGSKTGDNFLYQETYNFGRTEDTNAHKKLDVDSHFYTNDYLIYTDRSLVKFTFDEQYTSPRQEFHKKLNKLQKLLD